MGVLLAHTISTFICGSEDTNIFLSDKISYTKRKKYKGVTKSRFNMTDSSRTKYTSVLCECNKACVH